MVTYFDCPAAIDERGHASFTHYNLNGQVAETVDTQARARVTAAQRTAARSATVSSFVAFVSFCSTLPQSAPG